MSEPLTGEELELLETLARFDPQSSVPEARAQKALVLRLVAEVHRLRADHLALLIAILPFEDDVLPRTMDRALESLAHRAQTLEDLKLSNQHNYNRAILAETGVRPGDANLVATRELLESAQAARGSERGPLTDDDLLQLVNEAPDARLRWLAYRAVAEIGALRRRAKDED